MSGAIQFLGNNMHQLNSYALEFSNFEAIFYTFFKNNRSQFWKYVVTKDEPIEI